jgi:hypothetical protein
MYNFYSKTNPRVTVVGEHSEGKLKLAVARCSSNDRFVRETGRKLASDRLAEGKIYITVATDECKTENFIRIASVISEGVSRLGVEPIR